MVDRIMTQALLRRVDAAVQAWPHGAESVRLDLDDTAFLPGTICKLTFAASWDGGVTWPYSDPSVIDGSRPHRGQDGTCHFAWGPFMRPTAAHPDGETVNPTHYRASIEPVRGVPVIGVR